MRYLMAWLGRHRRITLALVVAYFVIITVGHDLAQAAAFWAQDKLSRERWNALNRYVGIGCVIVLVVWCVRGLRRCRRPGVAVLIGTVTTVCAVVSFNTLLMVNVEMVHFPQYALLALMIFPLTRRYGETVLLATMLGAVDEGYQYLVLHGNWNIYFDLNDVTLNLLGAGFGVTLAYLSAADWPTTANKGSRSREPILSVPALVTLAAVIVVGIAGFMAGYISVLPREGAWLVLRRCGPAGSFWIQTDWGKQYHVLEPLEAMCVWAPLLAMYFLFDLARERKKDAGSLLTDEC